MRALPLSQPVLAIAFLALAPGCGLSLGEGTIDDPVPSGTVIKQGTFKGFNDQTVTGVVSVWQQSGGSTCTFVLRLQALSAPTTASLRVVPLVNGSPSISPTFYALRASTGNQNYTFTGGTCGANWAQVSLINPSETPAKQAYGIADLDSVN
jgi:hypothetical protein